MIYINFVHLHSLMFHAKFRECLAFAASFIKVHYPKLYNMAHLLSLNVFTASKGSNNYILFQNQRPPSSEEDFLRFLLFISMVAILVM